MVASPTAIAAAIVLLQAYDYARDAGVDPWQFAIDRADLEPATELDLRWLIARWFAEHAQETTTDRDPVRTFRPIVSTAFPARTCLVLTDAGASAFRPLVQALSRSSRVDQLDCRYPIALQSYPPALLPLPLTFDPQSSHAPAEPHTIPPRPTSSSPVASHSTEAIAFTSSHTAAAQSITPTKRGKSVPHWDAQLRELRLGNKLVKRFRVPAANQELILNVFEEEGWPECIDDPLPPKGDDPTRRLQATIKSLNRHQSEPLIRFHGNGEGAVWWERARPTRASVRHVS